MKIAILGAGALGSVFGGLLSRAGLDVRLLDVNDEHIAAIDRCGLRLDLPEGTSTLRIPAGRPEDCAAPIDLIILLTKTIHTEVALASVPHLIASGAHVLTIQNGLGNAERVARQVPRDRVLYGCTMAPGIFHGPGHVETQSGRATSFKPLTEAGMPFAREVAQVLADVEFSLDPDADRVIWRKVAFNCAMNAISGLTGAGVGLMAEGEDVVGLARRSADAVVAVAGASGIEIEAAAVHRQMDDSLAHHRSHRPSMLQDMEAGRPTEIESLCGEVARQAARLGIAAPINGALATLVRLKERRAAHG
jgi:2-dehydropantoate 2-reductase